MERRGVGTVVGEEEMRVRRICCRQNGPTLVAGKGCAAITGRPRDWAQQFSDGRRGHKWYIVLLESTFALAPFAFQAAWTGLPRGVKGCGCLRAFSIWLHR